MLDIGIIAQFRSVCRYWGRTEKRRLQGGILWKEVCVGVDLR